MTKFLKKYLTIQLLVCSSFVTVFSQAVDNKNFTFNKKKTEKVEFENFEAIDDEQKDFRYFDHPKDKKDSKRDKDFLKEETADYGLKRGEKRIGFEVAVAPFRPTYFAGESEYDRSGRKLGMLNLTWNRVFGTVKNVTYQYEIKATPIAVALKNEVENRDYIDEIQTPEISPTIRKTTYGIGISPLGFRFLFRSKKRLKPYFATHAGILIFKNKFPVPSARRFNFTGDLGVGLQYELKPKKSITFGYKYFHISNMNFGNTNPGYNASTFYVGYSFSYD